MTKKIKVFIVGDSTAAAKITEKRPETGWGEMIPMFFNGEVEFENHAVNGRSSKSFIEEGRLKEISDTIGNGDFMFIQFGHNDEKDDNKRHTDPFTTYKSYISKYIEVAKSSGANPVLLTSIQRRVFNKNGTMPDTHGDYSIAMREVARQFNLPLIDMQEKSKNYFEIIGEEKAKEIFLWVDASESLNYPEGKKDNTHFCEKGAKKMAELVVEGIVENNIEPLSRFVKG
ncbi:rhamnogalacturonan acetylesterase [Clostridium estertheticum]|uniref:Rhamnogalacturonan acetylesterase n=1 Tax=Clostridium estertheticum TaxID=238834 RepID=A0AA47EE72_9CLOT|nr:rhamnogalacturonan acetylesterase [Clostridium estertheticum]MBU3156117.1 rhamnogalacturonan acetylesterase [Clostridium estertheticum]MBU3199348.1 rhamnogalacturonan acetylesterase [Clostridium estertheticum]WAG58557.1 rhamnogalacturonan acetylesterase [Clostridium estertheticum]WAG67407.1 rhamnogalacturonan acetylesterase [Clostridium estertheticum]